MPVAFVKREILRFLASKTPESLSLTGHWGVGKTFAWRQFLQQAKSQQGIALPRYAYVSLFGISSLDELRYAVFENTISIDNIGVEPNLTTLRTNTTAVAKQLGKKSLFFIQQLPIIKNHIGGLGPVRYLSVKETIICIDDIERRGKNLAITDVLGVLLHLQASDGQ